MTMSTKPTGSALRPVAMLSMSVALTGCLNNHHVAHGLTRSPSGVIDLEGGAVEISDSFSSEDSASIAEGYRAVMTVLRHEQFVPFLEQLEGRSWNLMLATSPSDDCEPITPQQITRALVDYVDRGEPLRVHRMRNYFKRWCSGTTAGTSVCGVTSTFPEIAEQWETPMLRSHLVNTIAHEMTHLLPTPVADGDGQAVLACNLGPARFLITDGAHDDCKPGDRQCDDAFLASYAFGDLVQCFHEAYCPTRTDKGFSNFEVCYDTTINMEKRAGLQRSGLTSSATVKACIGR